MSDETRAVQSAAGLKPGSNPEDPGGAQPEALLYQRCLQDTATQEPL